MDPLATQVARRFVREAGFIPDKFWRAKKTELRKILMEPLNRGSADHVGWKIRENLVGFFKTFDKELTNFGLHQFAEQSLDSRLKDLISRLEGMAGAFQEFHAACNQVPFPPQGVVNEAAWTIQIRVEALFEEKVKTLKDGLKGVWKTDSRLIRGLAERFLKKATPEELAAIEQASKEDYGPSSRIKWDFFSRMNVDTAVKRIVSVDKKTWQVDPLNWIDWLKEVFDTNYSEQKQDIFTQFDLYGVKVIIDDATVDMSDAKFYLRYFDAAYHALKLKKLQKVWYGTFFVKCQDCGGFNPNTGKWKDVGGNYPIGPDVVNVFVRPSSFIIELIAHELGHRYWFKFMSQEQRGKFESLVRAHKKSRPEGKATHKLLISRGHQKVDEAAANVRKVLVPLNPQAATKGWWRDLLKQNIEPLGKAGWTFSNDLLDAAHAPGADSQINPEIKKLFDDVLKAGDNVRKWLYDFEETLSREIHKEPEPSEKPKNFDTYWMVVYKREVAKWLEEAEQRLEMAVATTYIYIDAAVKAYNDREDSRTSEQWKNYNDEFDTDPRQVKPVSTYGESNIDEAFAEVFAHYVMEHDMNRDQLESFKSVLTKSASDCVVERWLQEQGTP